MESPFYFRDNEKIGFTPYSVEPGNSGKGRKGI